MNCLIWNCRGAGKKNFMNLIKDCSRIYQLDFLAILEPRISGERADKVIDKLGFDSFVKSDSVGFSGGIWCCWKQSCFSIDIVSVHPQYIHLHIDPNVQGGWFLTIVYAHPQERKRLELWEELQLIKHNVTAPWCVVGDFNSVLYEAEKVGGGPINAAAVDRFHDCLNYCELEDLGSNGNPFTW